jgi:hypothetical protein
MAAQEVAAPYLATPYLATPSLATRELAEAVVDEEELPEIKRRRMRGPRAVRPKRHEFMLSMEPFKEHNPGGGPFVGPPAVRRTESTGQFVPIPSSFQFREEEMIHFDDKGSAAHSPYSPPPPPAPATPPRGTSSSSYSSSSYSAPRTPPTEPFTEPEPRIYSPPRHLQPTSVAHASRRRLIDMLKEA